MSIKIYNVWTMYSCMYYITLIYHILVHIIINTYYHMYVIVRELLNFYEFPGDDIAIIKYVRISTSFSTSLTSFTP